MSSRTTRSQSRAASEEARTHPSAADPNPATAPTLLLKHQQSNISHTTSIPPAGASQRDLDQALLSLPAADRNLIRLKQRKLQNKASDFWSYVQQCSDRQTPASTALARAVTATFVAAQEAAGTAICISPVGLLLTCAHCVADSVEEMDPEKDMWWLTADGHAVKTRCVAYDARLDLALMQIVLASAEAWSTPEGFPFAVLASTPWKVGTALVCIGHPGSEDFEAATPGQATGYDVLHVSQGRYRGLATGQDVLDNSDIGALQHDCWTYWGHSGAPLVERRSGRLVGLHSSWDDETGMRRGCAFEALRRFLDEHTVVSVD